MILRFVLMSVVLTLLWRVFWRMVRAFMQGASGGAQPTRAQGPGYSVPMVRDPVCGTFLLPDRAVTITDGRERLYFCSTTCRDRHLAASARERPAGRTA